MKSRTTWKPPPIFGGKNNRNRDYNSNTEKSIVAENLVLNGSSRSMMTKSNDVLNKAMNGETAPTRRGKRHSIIWKPPPFFTSHPSIIAVEEEGKDEAFEQTAKRVVGVANTIDMHSNDNVSRDEALKTTTTQNIHGIEETEEEFVVIADENQKRIQKIIVETFRPFRNEIARFVANRFKANNFDNSNGESCLSKNCVNIDEVEGEESTIKLLMTAMEDYSIDHKDDFPRMDVPQKSIKVRELFSFWEGVRMTVCASTRLTDVSLQQLPQADSSSFPSSLLPPHVAQTPRKYRSIRVMSIARTRKQCERNDSITSHNVSMIGEKVDEPASGPIKKRPLKLQSLRAMSIARIRRETYASTDDATSRSTELATNNNKNNTKGDTQKIKKLLMELEEADKYQRRLEQQLKKAGVVIAEDIPYDLAKQKVAEIAKRMSELHDKSHGACNSKESKVDREAEYFKLEQEIEKYITALELTEEWIEEQAEEERKWEEAMQVDNKKALKMVLRHMPVDVRNQSELQLMRNPTPNGNVLPRSIAQKFKRTNCLQLLRTDPKAMVAWHPSMFENLRVTGLTLTERRALYQHLKVIGVHWKKQRKGGGDKMLERKLVWFEMVKSNFRECLCTYERHIHLYGPPENHPYAISSGSKGCPMIGKQCPLRADKIVDYSGDYGYPEDSLYFTQTNDDSIQCDSKADHKCVKVNHSTKTKGSVNGIQARESSPGRVGLLDDIKAHECSRAGRGGLLDDIKGPCRDRQLPHNGGLMDEIKCRSASRQGPDRGSLVKEIKDQSGDRGRLCDRAHGGSNVGGRSGLLAAIQARRNS